MLAITGRFPSSCTEITRGAVVSSMAHLSTMWSVGLAVLGIYVYRRSTEKAVAAGAQPTSALAALLGNVVKRKL